MNDLWLFILVIAKVSLLCGFAPAIALLILYVQVSERAVSHCTSVALQSCDGNKPAPEVLARAA